MIKNEEFTLDMKPYEPQQDEVYMSQAQRAHFREMLSRWKSSLLSKISATVDQLKGESAHFSDMNDRASQEEEFSLELQARHREAKLVARINAALEALEHEDYGYCEECGVEIGIRRLEARPTATLCIDCKTLQEIKEKRANG